MYSNKSALANPLNTIFLRKPLLWSPSIAGDLCAKI